MLALTLLGARPLWTDDPGLVERGKMEAEGGVEASGGTWSSYIQWKAGLGRVELDMGLGFDSEGNPGPVELETKWGVLPWLALVAGWAPGSEDYEAKLIGGWELLEGKAELLANGVYSSEASRAYWGVAGGYFLKPELLELVAEVYGEEELAAGAGFRLFLGELTLDAYGAYLTETKEPFLTVGFTFGW